MDFFSATHPDTSSIFKNLLATAKEIASKAYGNANLDRFTSFKQFDQHQQRRIYRA